MTFCPVNPSTQQQKKISKVEIQHILANLQITRPLLSLFSLSCPALHPVAAPGLGFCARWQQSRRGWRGEVRNGNRA